MNRAIRDFVKETVSVVLIAFVLAMILRTFVIEGRIIPTGSMLPTLQLQDRVLVNKFIYRFKEPQRGDIVVFRPPDAINANEDYIKRVIGLPGEKVEMKNGRVYINDKPLNEPYLAENLDYEYGPVIVPEDCLLVLGDNRNHSFDSHMWNAWLTKDRLKGKAFMVYWPVSHLHLLERGVSFDENTGN
ncbi:signal peptidase I [Thermosyntropha sp.]|uniref:signal peptidase I n=1 Tax=Thermosyntropha sp. TaxID=2740820 RepID=UPI0025CD062E|nr:signal peptidase I [Thermosyntropha sp.]MBO8158369.1 signal peptidase I [Thermosyntropha sp.]